MFHEEPLAEDAPAAVRPSGLLGVELRLSGLVGRVHAEAEGYVVRPDRFVQPHIVWPAPGRFVDVEWRVGVARYGARAHVRERRRDALVLGRFLDVRRLGSVGPQPWRLMFVDTRDGAPRSSVHRVRHADLDWAHVLVDARRFRADVGEIWQGRLRRGGGAVPFVAQVRGSHVEGDDGARRVVLLRWRRP